MSDYQMQHRPSETGAPLHDLTEGGVYPDDVYETLHYYEHGERLTSGLFDTLRAYRGQPDEEITIFRAVPVGVQVIDTGDWVTIDRRYAQQHGRHATDPAQDLPIISARVPAAMIRTDGNSLCEWGYYGPPVTVLKFRSELPRPTFYDR